MTKLITGNSGWPARALLATLLSTLFLATPTAQANSPVGACPKVGTTWDTNFYPVTMTAAGVGWVRFGFIIGTNTSWTSNLLASYDGVVNMFTTNGIQIIGLINVEAWPATNQLQWRDNSYEIDGGNGDNAYIDNWATNAGLPLIQHFADRIQVYELINEPNNSPNGHPVMYLSNWGQCMNKLARALRAAGLYPGNPAHPTQPPILLISGGVFGWDGNGGLSYDHSGAQYIDDMYNVSINHTAAFSDYKNTYGAYPIDGVGQHIYINQGDSYMTQASFQQCLTWVRSAMTKWEPSSFWGSKGSWITEYGWNIYNGTTQDEQDKDTVAAIAAMAASSYVRASTYYNWQDNSTTNERGIYDGSGNPRQVLPDFSANAHAQIADINIFHCDTNNALGTEQWFGGAATWSGCTNLSGTRITSGSTPCAASLDGMLYAFYRGTNGHLYVESAANNVYSGPQDLGGSLSPGSNPIGLVPPNGQVSVFYRGNDAALYMIQWNGSTWGSPTNLGGSIATNTSPCYDLFNNGYFNVYYHGTDGQLYTKYWYSPGLWGGPTALGGTLYTNSSPCAVNNQTSGNVNIFYRGTDNQLYTKYWANSAWGGPTALGGTGTNAMSSNPTATGNPNGDINCFYRGSDGQLYTKYWANNAWGGPTVLGGTMDATANPTSEVLSSGNVNCFYRGTDGALWTKYWNNGNGTWGGPTSLGGHLGTGASPYAIGH